MPYRLAVLTKRPPDCTVYIFLILQCPRLSSYTIRPYSSLLRHISANTVAVNSFGATFIGLIVASTWGCPRFYIVLSWLFAGYMEVSCSWTTFVSTSNHLVLVSIVQAWYYYGHQNDSWVLKSLVLFSYYTCAHSASLTRCYQVAAVMTFDTVHQALISHSGEILSIEFLRCI